MRNYEWGIGDGDGGMFWDCFGLRMFWVRGGLCGSVCSVFWLVCGLGGFRSEFARHFDLLAADYRLLAQAFQHFWGKGFFGFEAG